MKNNFKKIVFFFSLSKPNTLSNHHEEFLHFVYIFLSATSCNSWSNICWRSVRKERLLGPIVFISRRNIIGTDRVSTFNSQKWVHRVHRVLVHHGWRPWQNRILILVFFMLRAQFCNYKKALDILQLFPSGWTCLNLYFS